MHAEAGEPIVYSYYGNAGYSLTGEPLPTITTVDRFALVDGDGLRMLTCRETAAAQGFRPDYVFCGTKRDQTKQIGNSVEVNQARALAKEMLAA
jgi:DNA (cytosine-5)-methyltransferase 1